jgi:hypothetical protein
MYSDSRYSNGFFYKAYDARSNDYFLSVNRVYPSFGIQFSYYTWLSDDRLDKLANDRLGNPDFWWKILDVNPEIIDPFNIPPGTTLRIPHGQ